MDLDHKLKEIEEEEARLARQRKELLDQKKKQEALDAKLDKLFTQSGYDTPRQLVEALIAKYNVKFSGRKKAAASGKRRRTRVTANLRDEIKKAIEGGQSKNSLAKETGISYVVISKIEKGEYDHL
ncbi:MAG: hypothetical protein ACFB21_00015 [Opitutales bacterium]